MSSTRQYSKAGQVEWTRLSGNMLLALMKGVLGGLSGSKALLADALRSAADAVACLKPSLQLRLANRSRGSKSGRRSGRDDSRGEVMATLIVSVTFLIIGLEIGISAIGDIVEGVTSAPAWYSVAAIMFSLLMQVGFQRSREGLSGLYCSFAALVGAGTAIIGGLLTIPALYYCDPAAAVVIAVFVINKGYHRLAAVVQNEQTDDDLGDEDPEELIKFVSRIDGVIAIPLLKAKEQGHYVVAEIIISVNPRITVLEGNDIAKRVKLLIMKRYVHITDVLIHVEPYDPGYPYKSNHHPNQEQMPTLLQ